MQLDTCTQKELKQTQVCMTFVISRMNIYLYVLCSILVVIDDI